MPLICLICQAPVLEIAQSIELPPDARSDEITLQLLTCPACGFKGLAAYQESRRGASDRIDHQGYMVSKTLWTNIQELIKICPTPQNKACACPTHQALGKTHQDYWLGVVELIQDIEPNSSWEAAVFMQGYPLHFKA